MRTSWSNSSKCLLWCFLFGTGTTSLKASEIYPLLKPVIFNNNDNKKNVISATLTDRSAVFLNNQSHCVFHGCLRSFRFGCRAKGRSRLLHLVSKFVHQFPEIYTVKLAGAKLPANAGNFTCSSQVKRSLAQFTCVTCSLPVITGKFTCFEATSTSRRTQAHWLRAHVNLPEYHRYFTGSFTCGTHANLPATSMQNCLLLQAKIHATYRQKHWNRR